MEEPEPKNDELYAILKGGGLNKKTKKESKLLQNKQKREKKQKSNIARWMQSVYKVKNPDPGAIKSLIEKDFSVSPDEATIKIMDILSKAKVINGTLSLSDNFANEPIYTCITFNYNMSIFSNDGLFNKALLASFYDSTVKKAKKNSWDEAISLRIPMCRIVEAYCISNTFIMEPSSITEKGYYQDFEKDESFIGFNPMTMSKENITNVIKNIKTKTEFLVDRRPYVFYGNAQRYSIVVPKDMANNISKITQDILNTKLFSITKKPFELGLKEIKIKNKHAYYMDMKYKLENFCPAYLKTGQKIEVKMGFKIVYDLNDLFNYLEGCFKNKLSVQRDLIVRQTIFWNSLDTYFDLIGLLGLVGDFGSKLKEDLVALYGRYFELKYLINEWKKNQLLFKTILKEFYNIFGSAIMYDKIANLLKKVDRYISDRNELEMYDDSDSIRNLFQDVGDDLACLSFQMKSETMSLIQAIKGILTSLSKGTFDPNILNEVKQIGQAIYQMSLFGQKPMVDIVVSPGAFLGKLYDSSLKISENILDAVIGKYVKKLDDEEKKKNDRIANYKKIKKNMNKIRDDLVKDTALLIVQNTPEIKLDDKETFAKRVVNEINWNDDIVKKIDDYILQEYYIGNTPNTGGIYAAILPFANVVYKRIEEEKSEKELQKALSTHKQNINNLKVSEDNLNMDIDENLKFTFPEQTVYANTVPVQTQPNITNVNQPMFSNPISNQIQPSQQKDDENYFDIDQNEIREQNPQNMPNLSEVNVNKPGLVEPASDVQTTSLFKSNIKANPPRKPKRIKVVNNKMYELKPSENYEDALSMKTFYPTHTTNIIKTSSNNDDYMTEKQIKSGESYIRKKSIPKEITKEAESLIEKKNIKVPNISIIKKKESKSKPKVKTQLDKLIESDEKKEKELDEMIKNFEMRKSKKRKKNYGDREEEYGDTDSSFIEKDYVREPVRFKEKKPVSLLTDYLKSYEMADDKDELVIRNIKFNEKALDKISAFYHNLFRMFQNKNIFANFQVPYNPRQALKYIAKYAPISDVTVNYILDMLNEKANGNYIHIDKMLEYIKNNKLGSIYVRFPAHTLSPNIVGPLKETMLRESKQWVKYKIPQAKENFNV